ncbi:hypothetical protein BY996DRAFT_6486142 [Phakopsora pachyrhizi]|nr:hypothetical protein BY996DRAFT_6486142 [Phakopsora pachyrhizi]
MPGEGLTKGRNRRKGDVDIAEPTTQGGISQGRRRKGYRRANDILQGRRRKGLYGLYGPTKARMRFGGIKVGSTDKEAVMGGGKEDIKGVIEGMGEGIRECLKGRLSVRLVRRRETPHRRRTDIGGISKTVVGRARAVEVGRRARRRHTEVRSSYHFRVRTKVNSTT